MDQYVMFGLLSGVLQIVAGVPYFRSILRRETKPNIVSQFLWTVLSTIAIIAQLQSGWSWSVLILMAVTFNTTVFTLLCLKGYGYRGYSWIDYGCFVAAISALSVWALTDNALWVLLISMGTSTLASIPTFVKVFKYPDSENSTAWLIMSVASLFSILSVVDRSLNNLVAPVLFLLESSIIGWVAFFGRHPFLKNKAI